MFQSNSNISLNNSYSHFNVIHRPVSASCSRALYQGNHVKTFFDFTENCILAVKMGCTTDSKTLIILSSFLLGPEGPYIKSYREFRLYHLGDLNQHLLTLSLLHQIPGLQKNQLLLLLPFEFPLLAALLH